VGCYGNVSKVSRRSHLSVTSVRLNGSGSSIPSESNTILARMRIGCGPACAGLLPGLTVASGKGAARRDGGQAIESKEKRYLISA